MSKLAVVIMAAGKGTRMNDPNKAKVMFHVGDRPMIGQVIDVALACEADLVVVIIGYMGETVREYVEDEFSDSHIAFAEQREQLGTAHAVLQATPHLQTFDGDVLVLSGDVPLITGDTLTQLIDHHRSVEASGTLLSVQAPDPTGYGRVIRNVDGSVSHIVEHKDASDEEREVDEINAGIYVFRSEDLLAALPKIGNDNAQGEYYLPDVFGWFKETGRTIAAWQSEDFSEIQGVNTVEQLSHVHTELTSRISQ